jgi:hypothetical protein
MNDAAGTSRFPDSIAGADSRSGGPSRVRRRLILAAGAALPSVYTLASGAQTAIASHLTCAAKEPTIPPARFTDAPDSWYRAPVSVGDYDGTPAHCVTMPQAACADPAIATPKTPLAEPGAKNARDGSVWIIQGNRVISNPHVPITNVTPVPRRYGIVYVDQAGTVATLDPNGATNLTPVHTSCWASVVLGGRLSRLG